MSEQVESNANWYRSPTVPTCIAVKAHAPGQVASKSFRERYGSDGHPSLDNLFAALDHYRVAVRRRLDATDPGSQQEVDDALNYAKDRVVAAAFVVEGCGRKDIPSSPALHMPTDLEKDN